MKVEADRVCGGSMRQRDGGSGGVSVECAWECCVGPQQVLLLVAHVGGRAGPGSVPRSGSPLNCTVWEDHHHNHQDCFPRASLRAKYSFCAHLPLARCF